MSREIDQRPGFHAVNTHHIGTTFHAPAPQRKPRNLWARIKAVFIDDEPERTCCDGLCADGTKPCPRVPSATPR